jgi:hypothetical protein
MDKVDILCMKDETILLEFSRRCIEKVTEHVAFKIIRPLIRHFMDDNVMKEIQKDRIIIEHAASVFDVSNNASDVDIDAIFKKTKEVDKEFIDKVSLPPLSLDVKYEDIEGIRKERIIVMARAVFDLLDNWDDHETFIAVIKDTYTEEHFREVVFSILHLYNRETEMISNSVKILSPFAGTKSVFTKKLFPIMEETAQEVVNEQTKHIFGGAGLSCRDRT